MQPSDAHLSLDKYGLAVQRSRSVDVVDVDVASSVRYERDSSFVVYKKTRQLMLRNRVFYF